jgi:hypothetical protein
VKKKDDILASIASRLENLTDGNQDEKELLVAELYSFLEALDKHELIKLATRLEQTQIPEQGKVAALLRRFAAEKNEVHAVRGQHRGAKVLRRFH